MEKMTTIGLLENSREFSVTLVYVSVSGDTGDSNNEGWKNIWKVKVQINVCISLGVAMRHG